MNEEDRLAVEAYHDGELVGLSRRRLERRLRKFPELRKELDELEELSAFLVADAAEPSEEIVPASLGTWQAIAGALPAIDAQVEEERRLGPAPAEAEREVPATARGGWIPWGWATGIGAAAALAITLVSGVGRGPIEDPDSMGGSSTSAIAGANSTVATTPIAVAGSVRYLDTSGRSVMVIEEVQEDLTILWMMDEA